MLILSHIKTLLSTIQNWKERGVFLLKHKNNKLFKKKKHFFKDYMIYHF